MFTGIVRELGRVEGTEGGPDGILLRINAPEVASSAWIGDSVAINGCCLTAIAVDGDILSFEAVPETLSRSSLSRLRPGVRVNVEPALRAGDPLGGHIVQGHVDGLGTVRAVEPEGGGVRVEVEAAPDVLGYCVVKGSIAVEGVSLTVAGLTEGSLAVALIPHTLEVTTLGALEAGDEVNLEVDVLAKYVERLLGRRGEAGAA